MALKLLQSGKLLTRAFQNLQISPRTPNILPINSNINSLIVRHAPSFFNKCKFAHKIINNKILMHSFHSSNRR